VRKLVRRLIVEEGTESKLDDEEATRGIPDRQVSVLQGFKVVVLFIRHFESRIFTVNGKEDGSVNASLNLGQEFVEIWNQQKIHK